jgi:hypothetical protein
MALNVKCKCGVEINVAGVTSSLEPVPIYCVVCGTVTEHEIK